MNPMQPAAPAPSQPAAPAGADQSQGAAPAVCIAPQADGTFLVYMEDQGEDAGQPAQDIDSALSAAKQMLGGEPDADDQGGSPDGDQDDAEALFQNGFASARGQLGK